MTLFRNKYRVESTRLKNYDYSSKGAYFITICTKNREHFFGEIIGGKIKFSELGLIAKECWFKIPEHFNNVVLDNFTVMPNHVHGILFIQNDIDDLVETQNIASVQGNKKIYKNKFGPQLKNLSSIVRGYKIGVKKYATMNEINFIWQPRFYEHVICDDRSLNRIRQYIIDNPIKWQDDRDNLKN